MKGLMYVIFIFLFLYLVGCNDETESINAQDDEADTEEEQVANSEDGEEENIEITGVLRDDQSEIEEESSDAEPESTETSDLTGYPRMGDPQEEFLDFYGNYNEDATNYGMEINYTDDDDVDHRLRFFSTSSFHGPDREVIYLEARIITYPENTMEKIEMYLPDDAELIYIMPRDYSIAVYALDNDQYVEVKFKREPYYLTDKIEVNVEYDYDIERTVYERFYEYISFGYQTYPDRVLLTTAEQMNDVIMGNREYDDLYDVTWNELSARHQEVFAKGIGFYTLDEEFYKAADYLEYMKDRNNEITMSFDKLLNLLAREHQLWLYEE
ncbi:hypothetical protein [Evansella cellulosilytica]|uniref:Uncharacterized protein n=1 Tax=Evansella cellulosilytica (strain ATCC 21833 / DSM 2522 / FERM P-1141 / JCM 9156 / N-4) TaxID=649639 RepID=E6TTX7_EVAC2|nr:hypothetical protein [Evansella cellulosilytica]ADU32008.1 hypothetical protein Bcell_3768 [Evansella cellulosilytica DSM 2522]